jgi:hypothetical protein
MVSKIDNELIKKIKNHKKYHGISEDVIVREIEDVLSRDSRIGDIELVKNVRAKLHRLYSSYQTGKKGKREGYLVKLKNGEDVLDDLLSMTLSTKERKNDYAEIYSKIFSITGKPKKIVDLGCGMNLLSFPLMNLDELKYYGYDIDIEDVEYLNKYIEVMGKNGLRGRCEVMDVRNLDEVNNIPKSDVVFMFKLVDLIDSGKGNVSEELIVKLLELKCKWVVVSFATRTLTRRSMRLGERRGFMKMLSRRKLKFEKFSTGNEVFYVVSK